MMKKGLGLIIGFAIACSGAAASAQENNIVKLLENSSREVGPPKHDNPVWAGEAGLNPPHDATLNKFPGEHGVGGIILEYPVAPSRTGRITAPVALAHQTHGAFEIAANTPVFAKEAGTSFIGSDGKLKPFSRWIEWCTFGTHERGPVCARLIGTAEAHYEEMMPGGRVTYPFQLSGRAWRGPAPPIEETPVALGTQVVSRLSIASIAADGIRLRKHTAEETYISKGADSAVIRFGTGVRDQTQLGGYAFTVNRGSSPDTVRIEFVDPR